MAIDVEFIIAQINQLAPQERLRVLAEVSSTMIQESHRDDLGHLDRWSRSSPTLDQMAQEQGVKPVQSLDELVSSAWPEDEPEHAFLDWLHAQRRQNIQSES